MVHAILEVKHLTKAFGAFKAVNDLSFSVKEGEIVGLLGPNGAGKTTTLLMILGIVRQTAGAITVFGLDVNKHREAILKLMNYSSASVRAPWRLKVWEHLYVMALLYEVDHVHERITEVLQAFSLEPYRQSYVDDLSAGNLARLNVAKAFINHPKLVLLDEPTSSLDPDIAERVRAFIATSRRTFRTTILLTSHNMAEVEKLCDRVIFINHGRIVAEDTPERLARKIRKTHVRLMVREGQRQAASFVREAGFPVTREDRFLVVEIDEEDIAYLLAGLADRGVTYDHISIDKPTLENFFIGEVRDAH